MEKPDKVVAAWCREEDGKLKCRPEYPWLQEECCYYQPASLNSTSCLFGAPDRLMRQLCLSQRAYNDFGMGRVSVSERFRQTAPLWTQSITDANAPYLPEESPIERAIKQKDEEKKQKAIEALQKFIEGRE